MSHLDTTLEELILHWIYNMSNMSHQKGLGISNFKLLIMEHVELIDA